ncbi:MAG: hypothetical protein O7F70_06645 [Gemmatimonadetes bacterium]|nr:hypothetical protein [Gemmatimonadota bacterium]
MSRFAYLVSRTFRLLECHRQLRVVRGIDFKELKTTYVGPPTERVANDLSLPILGQIACVVQIPKPKLPRVPLRPDRYIGCQATGARAADGKGVSVAAAWTVEECDGLFVTHTIVVRH